MREISPLHNKQNYVAQHNILMRGVDDKNYSLGDYIKNTLFGG